MPDRWALMKKSLQKRWLLPLFAEPNMVIYIRHYSVWLPDAVSTVDQAEQSVVQTSAMNHKLTL